MLHGFVWRGEFQIAQGDIAGGVNEDAGESAVGDGGRGRLDHVLCERGEGRVDGFRRRDVAFVGADTVVCVGDAAVARLQELVAVSGLKGRVEDC